LASLFTKTRQLFIMKHTTVETHTQKNKKSHKPSPNTCQVLC